MSASSTISIIFEGIDKGALVLSQRITTNLSNLGKVAAVGLSAAGAAVGTFATSSVDAAADFEQGMSSIKAVSGATAQEMQQISKLALQLGKDTAYSAGEAAAGIEELIKGGIAIPDIMNGAAKSMLNLAAAGEVSIPDAAEIASNAMAVFNLKGEQMARVSDLIAGAANASSLSVTDFKFSLAASGAVAASVGQSFDDLAQAIAVMGKSGIKGSDAGTSLKTMLSNLQPQSKAAAAVMKQLGIFTIDEARLMDDLTKSLSRSAAGQYLLTKAKKDGIVSAQELYKAYQKLVPSMKDVNFNKFAMDAGAATNAFIDQEGRFKSMAKIAGILKEKTAGLSDAQRQLALQTIFGSDAIRAAAIFAREGTEGFDLMAGAMGKVTAESVGAERLNNFKGALEQMKGSFETLQIVIGTALLPVLTSLLNNVITPGINQVITFAQAIGAQLAAAFQGLMATVAPVGSFIGANFVPILAGLAAMLTAIVAPALMAMAAAALATVVALTPVVAPILAIGVAAATLAAAWQGNWLGIQGVVMSVLATLMPAWEALKAALGTVLPLVDAVAVAFGAGGLGAAFSALLAGLPTVLSSFQTFGATLGASLLSLGQQFVSWIAPLIPQVLTALQGYAVAVSSWIVAQAPLLATQLLQWGTAFIAWIAPYVSQALAALGQFAVSVGAWIMTQAPSFLAQLATWGLAFVNWIAPYVGQALAALGQFAVSIGSWIVAQVPAFLAQLASWGMALVSWIAPYVSQALAALQGYATAIGGWIVQQAPGFVARLQAWGTSLVQWIAPAIPRVLAGLASLGSSLLGWIGAQVGPIAARFMTWAQGMVQWIPGATVRFLQAWPAMLNSFLNWIAGAVGPILAQLGRWSIAFVQWIAPMIPNVMVALGGLLLALGTFIAQTAAILIGKIATEWAPAFFRWVAANAIPGLVGALAALAQSILGWIGEVVRWLPGKAGRIGTALVDGISNYINPSALAGKVKELIVSGIQGGIAGVKAFFGIKSPSRKTAEEIGLPLVQGIAVGFVAGMPAATRTIVAEAADLISKVSSAVSAAVDASAKLSGFKGNVSTTQVQGLIAGVTLITTQLLEATQGFKQKGLEAAGVFADTAGKAVGLIGGAVDALNKLGTLRGGVTGLQLQPLVAGVALIVIQLSKAAEGISTAGVEAAGRFADGAGKAVGLIGTAIDILVRIADATITPLTGPMLQPLVAGIDLAVIQISEAAEGISREGLDAATQFSEGAGKALSVLSSALDVFTKLQDLKDIPARALEALAAGIDLAVRFMVQVARGIAADGLKAANEFASSAGAIFDALTASISFLLDLAKYNGVLPEQFGRFEADFNTALATVDRLAVNSAMFLDRAKRYAKNMAESAKLVEQGNALANGINSSSNGPRPVSSGIDTSNRSAGPDPNRAGQNVGAAFQRGVKTALEIRSPSGVADREVGVPYIQGVARGIQRGQDAVLRAIAVALGAAPNGFADAARAASDTYVRQLADGLKRKSSDLAARLTTMFGYLASLDAFGLAGSGAGQAFIDDLVGKIQRKQMSVTEAITQIADAGAKTYGELTAKANLGRLFIADIVAGIRAGGPLVAAAVEGLFDVAGRLGSFGGAAISRIKDRLIAPIDQALQALKEREDALTTSLADQERALAAPERIGALFSGLGDAVARMWQSSTVAPLATQIDALDAQLKGVADARQQAAEALLDIDKRRTATLEERATIQARLDLALAAFASSNDAEARARLDRQELAIRNELLRIDGQLVDIDAERQRSLDATARLSAQTTALERQRTAATAERQRIEAKVGALQNAQQQLSYLKQQRDFIAGLRAEGLDVAQTLGGVTLGLGASQEDLLDAMTRGTQEMVRRANDMLLLQSGNADALVSMDAERARLAEQRLALEQKITYQQQQQQNLDYLKSQFELVKLIQDYQLDPKSVLGGMQLGASADPVKLLEASGRAMQNILNRLSLELGAIPGFAHGVKNFSGGLAIVGERGPELAYLQRGTNVYPNTDPATRAALDARTGNTYNITYIRGPAEEEDVRRDIRTLQLLSPSL